LNNGLVDLKRLSQVKDKKDIKKLSYAQFPGTHCPLFGVALTALLVEDMKVLVVGTEECTYYTKMFAIGRETDGEGVDNVFSLVMEQDEVVFGAAEALKEALLCIDREYQPKAILIVTTCIPEIIGEDYDAVIQSMQQNVSAKLICVKTEHFRCSNHLPGIERTLEAFADVMEARQVKKKTVNILGHRHKGIENTELISLLKAENIEINLSIPSRCAVGLLREAASAQLNIVTDATALSLAKKMKERFGTDYVYFGKYGSSQRISSSYEQLSKKLGLKMEDRLETLRNKAQTVLSKCREQLCGKSFIYGNTPLPAFEACSLLCSLGMNPIIIQANDVTDSDQPCVEEILSMGNDPLVTEVANIAPLRKLYAILKPDFYIGHEYPHILAKHGIAHAVLDPVAWRLGFELIEKAAEMLVQASGSIRGSAGEEKKHAVL
jgi:nitrogenase molybdenum-cofactor synthesis protein NifE